MLFHLFCQVPEEVQMVLLQPALNCQVLQHLLDLHSRNDLSNAVSNAHTVQAKQLRRPLLFHCPSSKQSSFLWCCRCTWHAV